MDALVGCESSLYRGQGEELLEVDVGKATVSEACDRSEVERPGDGRSDREKGRV